MEAVIEPTYKQQVVNLLTPALIELHKRTNLHTDFEYLSVYPDGSCSITLRSTELCPQYWCSTNDMDSQIFLSETLEKIFLESYPNVLITQGFDGSEKGYWSGTTIKLKDVKVDTKQINSLNKSISTNQIKLSALYVDIKDRILNQKSTYKGCPSCGSKVNKKFFKSHRCPVCCEEILTETDSKRINKLSTSIDNDRKKLELIS